MILSNTDAVALPGVPATTSHDLLTLTITIEPTPQKWNKLTGLPPLISKSHLLFRFRQFKHAR
jgi:hypothetical protein